MGVGRQTTGTAAIVLAAGMSSRMGTPKQLLRLGEKTLLERTLDNVRASRVDEILLVLGASAEEIRIRVPTEGLKVVINPEFQQGMGTSLRTGLAALNPATKAVLVVLADQPFVSTSTIDQLIECHQQLRPQIVIPTCRGFRGNPVLLDRAVFPELMDLSGDIGCRAVFGSHTQGIYKLAVDDPGIVLDIDSSDDWQRLKTSGNPATSLREMPEREEGAERPSSGPELVIVGRDAMARALASLARMMQLTVTVADPLLSLEYFPEADRILRILDFSRLEPGERYVVVASRGQFDEEAVEEALRADAAYVALLANRKRADEIFRSLETRGISAEKIARVRAPAGVNIAAETPPEVALSIMAEIIAVRRRFTGEPQSGDRS